MYGILKSLLRVLLGGQYWLCLLILCQLIKQRNPIKTGRFHSSHLFGSLAGFFRVTPGKHGRALCSSTPSAARTSWVHNLKPLICHALNQVDANVAMPIRWWSNYPLVICYITMENHHFQWENPLLMVIFNSYVSHYQRVFKFRAQFGLNPNNPNDRSCQLRSLMVPPCSMRLPRRFHLWYLHTSARCGRWSGHLGIWASGHGTLKPPRHEKKYSRKCFNLMSAVWMCGFGLLLLVVWNPRVTPE